MEDIAGTILRITIMMVPFLLSISIHETAHAWTANHLGDPTARLMGRISLNPVVHADPIGTFLFPILGAAFGGAVFGWARPVPVNPINLKSYRNDMFWISLAGPLSNFILAFIFALFAALMQRFQLNISGGIYLPVILMLNTGIGLNLLLCFFNLIPLGPLDGAKIFARFLPSNLAEMLERMSAHGMIILIFLMFAGLLGGIIAPPMIFFANLFRTIAITILGG